MIKITITGENQITTRFADAPKVIKQSVRSAMTKTMRRVEKELEATTASAFDIPKNVLAKYRVKARRVGTTGLVWMGYNPIKSGYVGSLKQEDWGASARSYLFEGGFIAKLRSGHKGIFKRQGPARLPIQEQKISLLKAPVLAAQVRDRANRYYQEELQSQLAQKLTK